MSDSKVVDKVMQLVESACITKTKRTCKHSCFVACKEEDGEAINEYLTTLKLHTEFYELGAIK